MNAILVFLLALIPQTIEVRVTGLAVCEPEMTWHTETIDFREYVKGVLPNEWYPNWHEESLKAGAIAVKNYAISVYSSQGYLWDCNWNQVYDPTRRTEMTDKAIDDTWNYVLLNEGEVVRTYYNAYPGGCALQDDNCMPQWESQSDAVIGQSWQTIVMKYYEGHIVNVMGRVGIGGCYAR